MRLINSEPMLKEIRQLKEKASTFGHPDYRLGYISALSVVEGLIASEDKIDVEPVRHGRCALCNIKETGHGIIVYYEIGWEVCINKHDKNYFLVVNHDGNQIEIPIDYCYSCGAKLGEEAQDEKDG